MFNPFAAVFDQWFNEEVGIWRGLQETEGEEEVPFAVFPESPGLLPWGQDDNGNAMFWLTEGDPEHWPIIVRGEAPKYERFELPLTSFLARVLSGKLVPKVLWRGIGKKGVKPLFVSEKFEPTVKGKTVYELYVENGMRAGFWIMHPNWKTSGNQTLVRKIEGKSEGPLSGNVPEFGSPPVICDIYVDGKICQKNYHCKIANDPHFWMIEPPKGWKGK